MHKDVDAPSSLVGEPRVFYMFGPRVSQRMLIARGQGRGSGQPLPRPDLRPVGNGHVGPCSARAIETADPMAPARP